MTTEATTFKRRPGRPTDAEREERRKMMEQNSTRPPLREEDSREAAARRVAELRGHGSIIEENVDQFYIPQDAIPPGWHWEWKMWSVYGQENHMYQITLARRGWEAVPASRYPEMMPLGSKSETILREGQILMQIPKEIYLERKAEELRKAKAQVRIKEAQLSGAPDGHFERNKAQVKKGVYTPIEIPE